MKYSNEDEVFEVVATDRDPREDGAKVLHRTADISRAAAVKQAYAAAQHGGFASVYAPDGEAVFELKGA